MNTLEKAVFIVILGIMLFSSFSLSFAMLENNLDKLILGLFFFDVFVIAPCLLLKARQEHRAEPG